MNIEHELGLIHFNSGLSRRKDIFLLLIAASAIVYGALKLEQGEQGEYVTAKITQVDSMDYFGVVESLVHVTYNIDDVEYIKTLRTSGPIYFPEQEIELVYTRDYPESVSFAPPISGSVDAWCCIAVGIAILMI